MDFLSKVLSLMDIKSVVLLVSGVLMTGWVLRRPRNLPPGPYGVPFFGYIPNILYAWRKGEHMHNLLTRLGRKYGKILSFNVYGTPVIVLNDVALIREAFNNQSLCNKGFNNKLQVRLTGKCLMSNSTFNDYRKFSSATLRGFGVGKSSFEDHCTAELQNMIKQIKNNRNGKAVDPTEILYFTNANITCPVLFGTRFDYDDEKARELLAVNWAAMQLLGPAGYEIFLPFTVPTSANKTLWAASNLLFDFINKQQDKHEKAFDADDLSDYTDKYLNEVKTKPTDSPNSHLNKDNMAGMLYFLFMAGADPVTAWIHWALVYLAAYPEVQKRVQEELDSVVGRNRFPKQSDQSLLPYLKAFIHELNRAITLVPLSHMHAASADVQFHGYTIPKGSVIVGNLWSIHHDPAVWSDPHKFKPERFLNESGEFVSRDGYVPYGIGRRNCLGESLAKIETYLFLTHLLHHFTFRKPQDQSTFDFTGSPGLIRSPTAQKIEFIERLD